MSLYRRSSSSGALGGEGARRRDDPRVLDDAEGGLIRNPAGRTGADRRTKESNNATPSGNSRRRKAARLEETGEKGPARRRRDPRRRRGVPALRARVRHHAVRARVPLEPPFEIASSGAADEANRALARERARGRRGARARGRGPRDAEPPARVPVSAKGARRRKPAAYVCRNFACSLPAPTYEDSERDDRKDAEASSRGAVAARPRGKFSPHGVGYDAGRGWRGGRTASARRSSSRARGSRWSDRGERAVGGARAHARAHRSRLSARRLLASTEASLARVLLEFRHRGARRRVGRVAVSPSRNRSTTRPRAMLSPIVDETPRRRRRRGSLRDLVNQLAEHAGPLSEILKPSASQPTLRSAA